MQPLSISSLTTATRGQLVGSGDGSPTIGRVEIDSRRVQPGDLFWALRGEHHDGHDFLVEARHHGATGAVVRRNRLAHAQKAWKAGATSDNSTALIAVDDTQHALADFARWYRSQLDAVVIGVTGSFGKTTTREMIHAVLSHEHHGVRSLRNFNNHIGLPLSLLELDGNHEFAVLEMGASAVGEIAELASIARPEIGVITGIGLAHVEGFGSKERIVQGKGELLEALPGSGFAVIPGDDPLTRQMADRAACKVLFVGEHDDNHLIARRVTVGNQWLSFEIEDVEFHVPVTYHVPVTGRHFLQAALTAVAIAREIGLSAQDIAAGLHRFEAVPGRCQVHRIGSWTVIDDSYNANPASMRAACEALRDWQGARKRLLVTGDMLELGAHTAQCHYELGQAAAAARVDGLLVFGSQAEHVIRGARNGGLPASRLALCDHFEILLTVLDCVLEPDDVILVKGSRGMRMERVIDWLRQQAPTQAEALVRECA